MSLFLLAKHKDNPWKVWLKHHDYQCKSEYSMGVAQDLVVKIYKLRIKNFPTRLNFLTKWSHLIAKHGDILKGLNQ